MKKVTPFISNIKELHASGISTSLENSFLNITPQRIHLFSSTKSVNPKFQKLPNWLKAICETYQVLWSNQEIGREFRYLNNHLIDISSKKTSEHHVKGLKLCDSQTTAFWINLIVACDGPVTDDNQDYSINDLTSKSSNRLPNAMEDLFALSEFYRPMRLGDPNIVYAGSAGRSEGFFDRTVLLANPSVEEFKLAIDALMHWVNVNSIDDEFNSFQFNFIYSGHAYRGDSLGNSNIFLGKTKLSTKTLVESLLNSTKRYNIKCNPSNVNIFLDCCYSAAVARDFMVHLKNIQFQLSSSSDKPLFVNNKVYCSSLDDEESFDEWGLGHSYFVSAYLRENSMKKSSKKWPHLHEVALRTSFSQNPVLFSFRDGQPKVRFPSMQLLKKEFKDLRKSDELGKKALQNFIELNSLKPNLDGFLDINIIDLELSKLKEMRSLIKSSEHRIASSSVQLPSYEERRHYWLL